MSREAIRAKTLRPQAVYGYYPVNSEGDDLIVYDPEPFNAANGTAPQKIEIARFSFPRQPSGEYLCISDYYAPTDSGQIDVVGLQVVTVGEPATAEFERLQSADNYSEAYFFHGLAVQAAEATANYMTHHLCKELGIPVNRGKRYSWGYPAIPELADHQKVFALLPAESELGMRLTEAYQLVPEQSTAAIIVHHPLAKYFNVGESRVEQLMRA